MAAAETVPERRRRVRIVAWSSAWLIVLLSPAAEVWHGEDHPAAVAAGLLAGFVAIYLSLLWVASSNDRRVPVPLALLSALTAIAVGGSLAYGTSWPFLFIFLSAAVAFTVPQRLALFAIVGVTVLDALVVTRPGQSQLDGGTQVFGVLMAGLVVLFIIRLLRLVAELNAAREELAKLAVADERLRFSRDLHDLLGHTLSLIVVKSEAVRRLVHHDAEAAARESGDIEVVSRQALAEVREAVANYRERSLEAELEGARVALSAAGIEATIRRPDLPLPTTVDSVLGWTVREGITNVVRHSNGRHCAIDLRQGDGTAVLEICDDGDDGTGPARRDSRIDAPGTSPSEGRAPSPGTSDGNPPAGGRGGTGLRGLAERLAAAHGRLEAGRRPGGGFRLAVTVPLESDGRTPA
jgi:two-component system sensor histidine kinase DesK